MLALIVYEFVILTYFIILCCCLVCQIALNSSGMEPILDLCDLPATILQC